MVMYILTPFTTSSNIHLFYHFRTAQSRLMLLAVIHGFNPNSKLKSILEGCTNLYAQYGTRTMNPIFGFPKSLSNMTPCT